MVYLRVPCTAANKRYGWGPFPSHIIFYIGITIYCGEWLDDEGRGAYACVSGAPDTGSGYVKQRHHDKPRAVARGFVFVKKINGKWGTIYFFSLPGDKIIEVLCCPSIPVLSSRIELLSQILCIVPSILMHTRCLVVLMQSPFYCNQLAKTCCLWRENLIDHKQHQWQ